MPRLAASLRRACLAATLIALGCGDADGTGGGGAGAGGVSGGTGGSAGTGGVAQGGAGGGASAATFQLTVRSQRATRIELWVYAAPTGDKERLTRELARDGDSDRWTISVPRAELDAAGVGADVYYGLRAWGPNWPYDAAWTTGSEIGFVADVDADGNRFNPNKLLFDPYARELSHDPKTPTQLDSNPYRSGPDHRTEDSAPVAPKALWLPDVTAELGPRPVRPLSDDVVYEVHVRGFTKNDPAVPEACRGTYAGAAEKAAYLADLGVTAIELLPVHETDNTNNDLEASTAGDNYWGYSTLAFFAPDRRYACDAAPGGATREFQAMVRTFHEHGIKVLLDVVYNHTAEGGGNGDTSKLFSLRGLDNAAYYETSSDGHGFVDNTGTGANTSAKSPLFRDLVLDSLRYWHEEMGVDGFRFDLASVLGDGCVGTCFGFDPGDPDGVLARAATELPARDVDGGDGVDLIAEPWGIGLGTYQLGAFPDGWSEWNGRYRDTLRKDMNRVDVDAVTPRDLVYRFVGSPDLFASEGRAPRASINFLVAHDGFTLRDLYSCDQKNNTQPWPYGPSDGGENNNLSWSYGGDPVRQRQAARTGLALLMLSAGTPMFTGGDELYRTQYCNNNAYNLDSDKNWIDWAGAVADADQSRFAGFARELVRFRSAHAALRPATWPKADDPDGNGLGGWAFLTDLGVPTSDAYLDNANNHFLAWRVDGEVAGDEARSIYVAYNGATSEVIAHIPPPAPGYAWFHVLDTASWYESEGNIRPPGMEEPFAGATYGVKARAVLVLVERPS